MRSILIAEVDDYTLRARGDELLLDGHHVIVASTGRQARARLAAAQPDALLLGTLDTPAASLSLLRSLRAGHIPGAAQWLAVLAIGGDSDHAAIRFYQAGADVVLPSTASPLLIKGALDSLCARTEGDQRHRLLRSGRLTVDCDARVASIDDRPLSLTRLEFDLLQTLARNPHRTITRSELASEVWGYDPKVAGVSRTIDSHASRLRYKLREAGPDDLVQTVRGVGYRLSR